MALTQNISTFTEEQKKLFRSAASLGTGVATTGTSAITEEKKELSLLHNQKISPHFIPAASLGTGVATTGTSAITPSSLAPVPSIPIPPTQTEDLSSLNSIIGGAGNTIQVLADAQAAETAANAEVQKNITSQSSLSDILLGKTADTQAANESSGLNAASKQLTDLNAQAQSLFREAQAIPIQIQQDATGRGVTAGGVAPLEAAKLRENALKALSLAQQADIATANYTAAKDKSEQIIALKYDPLEKQLLQLKDQLTLLEKFTLTPAETKRKEAQEIALAERARLLAEKKAEETTVQNIKLEVAKNGGNPNTITATTVNEAIAQAGSSLATATTDVVKLDNGNTILIDKKTGKIIKSLGGAKPAESSDVTGGAFNSLINTVSSLENTVAGKSSVRGQMAGYIKNQDYGAAYNQVANTVASGLTGETKNRFENSRIDREVLTGFKTALQQFKDAGGDTGLVKGSVEDISRKLLGVTASPELTALAVQLEREFQSYRQAMTGAAFTPTESREYAAVNPTGKKSFDLNMAVIDGALAQLTNRVDGTIRAKVPQATDLLKLVQVPIDAKQAKTQVDTLFLNNITSRPIIEKLLGQNFSDSDILEYLQSKGIITK